MPDSNSLYANYPSSTQIAILWSTYLRNVHPLVKIFFDWEIEPLIQKARKDLSSLSNAERALTFAITLIATLSLSQEECATLLSDKKSELFDRYQRNVEDALLVAKFATTTDKLVLQAFMLYLVRFSIYPIYDH